MMKSPGVCNFGICQEPATETATLNDKPHYCCKLHADMIRHDGQEAWSIYAYVAPKRKGKDKQKKSLKGQNLPQVGLDRRYTYEDALELFTAWCESGQYVRVSIAHYPPRSSCGYLRNDWYKEQ